MVIAFEVNTESKQVSIIDLFYGGQDYESLLLNPEDREDTNKVE
jgi:hypothetical protein